MVNAELKGQDEAGLEVLEKLSVTNVVRYGEQIEGAIAIVEKQNGRHLLEIQGENPMSLLPHDAIGGWNSLTVELP